MGHDDEQRALFAQGRAEFESARWHAFWTEMRDLMLNRPVGLLSFDDIREQLHLNEQVYRGLKDIPVENIVGSVGRYRDFTSNFLPRKADMVHRWSNVYAHMNNMTGLPPIDVYKVDDVYFVRDGNHRVSIARATGMPTIEAYVTELRTPIHLSADMTPKDLSAAAAYGTFLDKTKLDINRPKQEAIQLSEADRYNDLLDHIRLMQQVMEHQRGYGVALERAAMRWYDTIYTPVVELIRKYNVLDKFPKRTEADLYVWISEHLKHLIDRYGEDADEVTLSNAMVDFLAENKIPVPKRLLTEQDKPLSAAE